MKPLFTYKTLTDLKNIIFESNRVVSVFLMVSVFTFWKYPSRLGIDGLTSICSENDSVTRRKTIKKY